METKQIKQIEEKDISEIDANKSSKLLPVLTLKFVGDDNPILPDLIFLFQQLSSLHDFAALLIEDKYSDYIYTDDFF